MHMHIVQKEEPTLEFARFIIYSSKKTPSLHKGSGGTEVKLRWCPGHVGIEGNEKADREAGRAAQGQLYPPELIPQFLESYQPPLNPLTRRRKVKEMSRTAAIKYWEASEAGEKYRLRYPTLSPRHFLAHTHQLPRSRATLLFRLVTGHIQLQAHLYRLQLVDSPHCKHCQIESETVSHFLLKCPRFAAERHTHLTSHGHDFLHLSFLLFATCALDPLFDFIKATGRLRDLIK
ncbi:hypothetical protein RSOLAG22IIIB_09945 [Rhizoctonia solani]|uniref:RNase H type-1 domain-containing protein n=1 Tax=Rhizoctonia solani TaxID=456999 RepID=A0A0K6G124_9AGAM|nr:hypothetical protein RSOLAG22IIIB_09945 [Rhizoctonia solani]